MKTFCFCITSGVDGYLPDNQDYFRCENSIDAFDAIKDALREFQVQADYTGQEEYKEFDWKPFFETGCSYPNASQWSFLLARDDNLILSLQGMTDEEYERECGE